MGNTHSNRIEDNRRRQGQGSSPESLVNIQGQQEERSQAIQLRPTNNSLRSSDIEIKT